MLNLDINCDMGEGIASGSLKNDEALMEHVSSINIACGFHAGCPETIIKTVISAIKKNVSIGAHPGLPDKKGFGRIERPVSVDEAYAITLYQTAALQGIVRAYGGRLHHVKPHGALYNMAARNHAMAEAIASAIFRLSPDLILYGLAGSHLIEAGRLTGLRTASEVFADRSYQADGTLTPRTEPDALFETTELAVSQVMMMIKKKQVQTTSGEKVEIQPDTLCLHGDNEYALSLVKNITHTLKKENISIKAI